MKLRFAPLFCGLLFTLGILNGHAATHPECDGALADDQSALARFPDWRLSAEQGAALMDNMRLMSMSQYLGKTYFGNEEDWQMLFYHGVTVHSVESEAHKELFRILVTKHESVSELKAAMDEWAVRSGIPYKFAMEAEIKAEWAKYTALGTISNNVAIAGNGYIPPDLYSLMVQDGLYPLADPHDVFSHLSSLTNPSLIRDFNRYTNMMADLDKTLNFKAGYLELSVKAVMTDADPFRSAYAHMWYQLYGTVRDATHENWTYLRKGPTGKAELFLQGNGSFNSLFLGLRVQGYETFIREFLNLAGVDQSTFATEEIAAFPHLEEYLQNPTSKKFYEQYRHRLEESVLDRTTYKVASEKLAAFLERELGPAHSVGAEEAVKFLHELSTFLEKDPQLSVIFNPKTKEALLNSAMVFLEDYKTWVDIHLKK